MSRAPSVGMVSKTKCVLDCTDQIILMKFLVFVVAVFTYEVTVDEVVSI